MKPFHLFLLTLASSLPKIFDDFMAILVHVILKLSKVNHYRIIKLLRNFQLNSSKFGNSHNLTQFLLPFRKRLLDPIASYKRYNFCPFCSTSLSYRNQLTSCDVISSNVTFFYIHIMKTALLSLRK